MLKNALLVSHQLDCSGAPVALLYLAKMLIQDGWSVDLFSMHGEGKISTEFANIGVNFVPEAPLEIQYQAYQFVLFNTIVASPLIPNQKPRHAKWILWVHESPFLAGFAWSPLISLKNILNIDSFIFPTNSTKNEWSGFFKTKHSHIIPSPVEIPIDIIDLNTNHRSIKRTFCIIDPREPYRNIDKIETAILDYSEEAIFNFVGTLPPPENIHKLLLSKENIEVNYFGRIETHKALEILSQSDIYLSATSLATQNRGLCEALVMNKNVYISKIEAHKEIGGLCGLPETSYFFPLEKIDLKILFNPHKYSTNFLMVDNFSLKWKNVLA